MTQTVLFPFQAEWCFQTIGSGSSSETAIILLPIFCLYGQSMPIFCLCAGNAYILGWFPNLPIVTQSCVFSQSRQIHPGQIAPHAMLPFSKVTCYVSCENCDSSYFKWFLHLWLAWPCLPCVSHIITPCSDHWNAMCASVKSRQWNRSSMYQNKLYFFQWRDRERSCSRILFPWHYNLPHHGAMSIG